MFKHSGIVRYAGYKGEYSRGKGLRNKRSAARMRIRRKLEKPEMKESRSYGYPVAHRVGSAEPDFRGYDRFDY